MKSIASISIRIISLGDDKDIGLKDKSIRVDFAPDCSAQFTICNDRAKNFTARYFLDGYRAVIILK